MAHEWNFIQYFVHAMFDGRWVEVQMPAGSTVRADRALEFAEKVKAEAPDREVRLTSRTETLRKVATGYDRIGEAYESHWIIS